MRVIFQFLVLFLLCNYCQSGLAQEIEKHRWKDRLLLIYASSKGSDQLKEQLDILQKNKLELADRKLKVYAFTKKEFAFNFDKNWQKSTKLYQRYIPEGNDFFVLLIGLDGGIKLSQKNVSEKEELFAIIDGMPMRRNELKRKYKN